MLLQAVRPDAVIAFLRDAANECVRETFDIVEAPTIDPSGALDAIVECSDGESDEETLKPIPDMIEAVPEKFLAGLADAVATSAPAAPIVVVAPDGDFMDWRARVMAEVRTLARNAPVRRKSKVTMLDLNDEYRSIEVGCQT